MIRLRTLDNGVRIVSERIEAVRSCGIGLWIQVGSRYEMPSQRGLSHFIEHMLFKGTRQRDWQQIADTINYLGGSVNAYTTQEVLCLHARTIDTKAPMALDLLSEMLSDSIFPLAEIRRERDVVLEEHKMYEDNPEELTMDVFMRNLWPGDPLGQPIIGSRPLIRTISREKIMDYWSTVFRPDRILISIAGAFDAKACEDVIARRFKLLRRPRGRFPVPAAPDVPSPPRQSYLRRNIEQAHFCLGTLGPHRRAADRYAFGLMNTILGGGMSSRLFQEIREKRGLAYSIGSFFQSFSDRGFFAVAGGSSPANLKQVLEITMKEIHRIGDEKVVDRELELAREQWIDAMLMGLENTESRMMRQAESVMVHGRVISVDEVIANLRRVDAPAIGRAARKYLRNGPFAVASVGPREGAQDLRGRIVRAIQPR